jgi:hypothetical protein
MNRRTKLLLLLVPISSALAIVAACTFPELPGFGPDSTEGGADSPTADSPTGDSGDATPPIGANEDVDPDGGASDAMTLPEGGGGIDAASLEAGCCDCDDDQFKADGGACGKAAGDCDDLHPFLKPGQDYVAATIWNTTHLPTYDWDCNGAVTKQYEYGRKKCTEHSKLETCANLPAGFEENPACGTKAHYVTKCKNNPVLLSLDCVEDTGDDRVQGCR